MKKQILVAIVFTMIMCFSTLANATIVDISASTDKTVYQLGETVVVSIIVYNPNPEPVTLSYSGGNITYIMDNIFDWKTGKAFPLWVLNKTIDAYDFWTVELVHGSVESSFYPLDAGNHSVVGIIGSYGSSVPVQFEVVPEPGTLSLFCGSAFLIKLYAKNFIS